MMDGRGSLIWDLTAFFYDEFFSRFPPHERLQRAILDSLKKDSSCPCLSLLDAGCGTGIVAARLAREGYRVCGVDRSGPMLKRAWKKKEEGKLENLTLLQRDLDRGLEREAGPFQTILLIHSLYVMGDPQRVLQDLSSFLPPGGEVFMCNPSRSLKPAELIAGGLSFLREARKERGWRGLLFFLTVTLAVGALNVVIQRRKRKVYSCWSEEEVITFLSNSGLRLKWLCESCLGRSHLLLCAVKEE